MNNNIYIKLLLKVNVKEKRKLNHCSTRRGSSRLARRAAQRGVPRVQSVDASFIKTLIVNEAVKTFPICEALLNCLVSGFHLMLTHLLKTVFSMIYR